MSRVILVAHPVQGTMDEDAYTKAFLDVYMPCVENLITDKGATVRAEGKRSSRVSFIITKGYNKVESTISRLGLDSLDITEQEKGSRVTLRSLAIEPEGLTLSEA